MASPKQINFRKISNGGGDSEVPSLKCVFFLLFSIQLLKRKHTLNPEMTFLYQFHAQKALFKVPNLLYKFLDWKCLPPPLEVFRKIIRFGNLTRPYRCWMSQSTQYLGWQCWSIWGTSQRQKNLSFDKRHGIILLHLPLWLRCPGDWIPAICLSSLVINCFHCLLHSGCESWQWNHLLTALIASYSPMSCWLPGQKRFSRKQATPQ